MDQIRFSTRVGTGLIVVLLVAGVLAGCSGDSSNGIARRLGLRIFNADPDQSEGFPPAISGSISTVRVRVFQDGQERGELERNFDWGEPAGSLPQLDYGDNYQMVVEAISDQEGILADGATPLFSFHQDSRFSEIYVFTSRQESVEYASALFKLAGERVTALPTEFEGPFIAQSLNMNAEVFGGQRAGHTVTALPDGRLVVIGGARMTPSGGIGGSPFARFISTVEIFDPNNSYWSLVRNSGKDPLVVPPPDPMPEGYQEVTVAAPLELSIARAFHTATYIGNNRIMVVGGFHDDSGRVRASGAVDIIDIAAGTIETLGPEYADLQEPRALHTAHWIGNKLIVIGGVSDLFEAPIILRSIEQYETSRGLFDYIDDPDNAGQDLQLAVPRAMHSGTTLADGIIVAGGRTDGGVTDTIEFIELRNGVLSTPFDVDALPRMAVPRFGHAAVYIERDFPTADPSDRYIALAGGYTQKHPSGDSAMTLLVGTALTGTVEFFHTWLLEVKPALQISMVLPRAHFQMVETSTTKDLMIMGGIVENGSASTNIERLWRGEGGGLPFIVQPFAASMKHARAFATAVVLPTHNVMIIAGWDGTNSTASCGGSSGFTTGCTAEVANPGDLFFLGHQY